MRRTETTPVAVKRVFFSHRRVQEVVKIRVVAENHVAAHVKEEALGCDVRAGQAAGFRGL